VKGVGITMNGGSLLVTESNFLNNSFAIGQGGPTNVITIAETSFHGSNPSIYTSDGSLVILNSLFQQDTNYSSTDNTYFQTFNVELTIVNTAFFIVDAISLYRGSNSFFDSFFTSSDSDTYLQLNVSLPSNIQTKNLSISNVELFIEQPDTMQVDMIAENCKIHVVNEQSSGLALYVQFSELTNTSLHVGGTSLDLLNSNLYSSTVLGYNGSSILLGGTVIRSLGNKADYNSSVIILRGGSYLDLFNSTIDDDSSLMEKYWVDCDTSSWVTGDLLGWRLSPQCNLQYTTPFLTDTDPVVTLLPNGNTEMVGMIMPPQYGGIIIVFSSSSPTLPKESDPSFSYGNNIRISVDEAESLKSPVQQNGINIFLVEAQCSIGLVAQSPSSISAQIPASQNSAILSFVSPTKPVSTDDLLSVDKFELSLSRGSSHSSCCAIPSKKTCFSSDIFVSFLVPLFSQSDSPVQHFRRVGGGVCQ